MSNPASSLPEAQLQLHDDIEDPADPRYAYYNSKEGHHAIHEAEKAAGGH